jgi:hypothetical protein
MEDPPHPDDNLAMRIEAIKRLELPADEAEILIATLKQFDHEVYEQEAPGPFPVADRVN